MKIITAYDLGAEIARRQVASVKTASDLGAIAAVKQASAGTPPKPEVPQPEMPPRPKPNQTPQDRRRDFGGFDPPQPKPPTPPQPRPPAPPQPRPPAPPQPRPPAPEAGAPPAPQPKPGSLMDVTHDDFDSIPGMHIRRTTRTPATPEIITREQARRAFEAHPEYADFVKYQRSMAGGHDNVGASRVGNQAQAAPEVNPLRAQAMARDAETEPAFRAAIARGDNFVEFPSQFGGPPVRVPITAQNRRAFSPSAAAGLGALTGSAAAGFIPQPTQQIGINNNPAASRLKPRMQPAQGGLPQMPAGLDDGTRQKEIADQKTRDAYGLAPNTPIDPETERDLREAHGEGHAALTRARMNPSPQGFNAAIAGFEKYTKLAPQDPMGWQQLGVSMFERANLLPQGSQERENLLTEARQAIRTGVAFGMNDANGNPIDPRELQGQRLERIQGGPARDFLSEATRSVRRNDIDSILGRQRPQPGQPAPQGQPGQAPAPAAQAPAPAVKAPAPEVQTPAPKPTYDANDPNLLEGKTPEEIASLRQGVNADMYPPEQPKPAPTPPDYGPRNSPPKAYAEQQKQRKEVGNVGPFPGDAGNSTPYPGHPDYDTAPAEPVDFDRLPADDLNPNHRNNPNHPDFVGPQDPVGPPAAVAPPRATGQNPLRVPPRDIFKDLPTADDFRPDPNLPAPTETQKAFDGINPFADSILPPQTAEPPAEAPPAEAPPAEAPPRIQGQALPPSQYQQRYAPPQQNPYFSPPQPQQRRGLFGRRR